MALLPLLILDCLGNLVIGGSWRNTLSGESWHHREHRWWGFTHRWIDWAFACPAIGQVDHCRLQAEREALHAGVWRAWAADWRSARAPQSITPQAGGGEDA